ncbi:MAG: DUF2142 domain-containing protein [Alphaproteobacteria bacterium]|nr:DUF2142 domain-containing protein [Alphaproteobacteria bacterium]MBR1756340.1 DUF2142 domain-containing protein [Alphaproteobacteria bacterium]
MVNNTLKFEQYRTPSAMVATFLVIFAVMFWALYQWSILPFFIATPASVMLMHTVVSLGLAYAQTIFLFCTALDWKRFFAMSIIPLALGWGLIFLPWNTPDAARHLAAVYRLSNLWSGQDEWNARHDDANIIGEALNLYAGWSPSVEQYGYLLSYLYTPQQDKTDGAQYPDKIPKMTYYSVYGYLPQVAGLTLARALGFSTFAALYMARAAMLACYIAVMLLALHKIPNIKNALAMTAATPIACMLAFAFSYDGMVLLAAFGWLAYGLNLRHNETKTDAIGFIIFSLLLAAAKQGAYFVVMLPLLLNWCLTKSKYRKAFLSALGLGVACFALINLVLPEAGRLKLAVWEDDSHLSAFYAFTNPWQFIKMGINTWLTEGWDIIAALGGSRLAQYELAIPRSIGFAFLALSALSAINEKPVYNLTKGEKTAMVASIALCIILSLTMLLSFTPIDADYIQGIQGRYLLPIWPLVLLLLPKWNKYNLNKLLYVIWATLSAISLILASDYFLNR